jgi:hypothetical protein
MIVCRKCDDVLYTDTMPKGFGEVEFVMCQMCAFDYTMEYENNAYDIYADR